MGLARPIAILVTGAVSSYALQAPAQNVHISRLYEQVLENIEFANEGHVLDSYGVVRMNDASTARIEIDVPSDSGIQIMGDCDEDCVDLDLAVYLGGGKMVAEDRADDFYPIVSFESGAETRIAIDLELVDCSASYCYAAYSVFVRPQ